MKKKTTAWIWLTTLPLAALAGWLAIIKPWRAPTPDELRAKYLTPAELALLARLSDERIPIRIGHIPDTPPIDFSGGEASRKGITWDYVDLIEQNLDLHFVRIDAANWEEALRSGEVDLVGSIQQTPERMKEFAFSNPYMSVPMVILARKDDSGSLSLDRMRGKQVAAVEPSAILATLKARQAAQPERFGYRLVPVADTPQGMQMVADGIVDVLVADDAAIRYHMPQLNLDLRIAGDADYQWDLCFAARTNSPLPIGFIDAALEMIHRHDRHLVNQWPTLMENTGSDWEPIPLMVAWGVLALGLIVGGVVVVKNRTLRREVAGRLHELGHIRTSYDQTTRALHASEARFRNLVESSNDIIWEMDRFGCYTYISPRVRAILGYTPEELLGKSSLSLMPPEDSARWMAQLRSYSANGVIAFETHAFIHKDGRRIVLETNGKAYPGTDGQLAGLHGVSRDITERIQNEAALRTSEERFRNLVETTSDWIWETDTTATFTYLSPQASDLLGYAPDDLLGKQFHSIVSERDANRVVLVFKRSMAAGLPIHSLVNSINHRTGRTVSIETRAVPFYDKEWNIQGYRGISRDITERIAAEKKLEFERNLFRTFMQHAPELIYFKDAQGRFIEINTAKAEELRRPASRIIGKTDSDFLPPDQARQRIADEAEVMRTQKAIQKEETATTPDGERWYSTTKVPRFDENGAVVGTLGISWNITYRKRAEEELRHLRALLSNMIDSMPSILIGIDSEGRVIQWNAQAEKAAQLPAAQAIGLHLSNAFPALAGEMVKVERAIREQTTQREERVRVETDHRIFYRDVTVFPLKGDIEGAVIRVDDVTERVRIEEMMMQSEKMMSVGGLAAGMAHEINNPLAGIMQNLQVMQNRLVLESDQNRMAAEAAGTSFQAIQSYMESRGVARMLDVAAEAANRAARIVDNMLSFSRKSESHFSPLNLEDIVEKSLELAANDYDLEKRFDFRHIRIVRQFEKMDPVVCEEGQIQQVLLNLLNNSAQAMATAGAMDGKETPTITIRLRKDGDMALIEIEDNGPGMDLETRKRAFEPFFTTKEVGKGTGLGLSVSYFIITENHGGSMQLDSAPGRGACFSIRIPFEHRTSRWGLRL